MSEFMSIKITKLKSKTRKEFYTEWIINTKQVNSLSIPNSNFKFTPFVSVIWKKSLFEGFGSCWKWSYNRG